VQASATGASASVLLAGHSPARSHTLSALLDADGMPACREVVDIASTVAAASQDRPDLCLLDAAIAGAGYANVTAILEAAPGMRVVILAGSAGDRELLDAVAVGAAGHLPRDLHPAALTAALHDVLGGRPAFPRRVEALLTAALQERA
jgi:DNA-binding NarL/FixJ family response regulator